MAADSEAISVGSELLLGMGVDTNGADIGRALLELGCPLRWKTVVGDSDQDLDDAVARAAERSAGTPCTGPGRTTSPRSVSCAAGRRGRRRARSAMARTAAAWPRLPVADLGYMAGRSQADLFAATRGFPGVTGTITLDAQRNADKPAVVLQVRNGKLQFVERIGG